MAYVPVPNLSGWSQTLLQSTFNAVQTEMVLRATGGGRVQSGNAAAQGYQLHLMSDDRLTVLNNALTAALGLDCEMNVVRPCFSRQGAGAFSAIPNGTFYPP